MKRQCALALNNCQGVAHITPDSPNWLFHMGENPQTPIGRKPVIKRVYSLSPTSEPGGVAAGLCCRKLCNGRFVHRLNRFHLRVLFLTLDHVQIPTRIIKRSNMADSVPDRSPSFTPALLPADAEREVFRDQAPFRHVHLFEEPQQPLGTHLVHGLTSGVKLEARVNQLREFGYHLLANFP